MGYEVNSGRPQFPYWPVPSDCTDGQLCQVKNDDVSASGDPVGNVGGGIWPVKYRESRYLLVTAVASSTVSGLWFGVDGGVNDVSLQAPAWH